MPRILVADDNSNIHRTVALALKDAGVEVVAVGNGEAAVRKIAEIKPDLVLADIFMPVRSGYEVCEFVKKDPRFAQTPVVLLIGAFDPFDEREAQRVQADGILKKPFVPPDSLLRMVAELLAQSAARMAPAAVVAGVAKADRASTAGIAPLVREAESAGFMDAPPEEFAPAKARLEWNGAQQPVAFSTLLETPFADTEDSVVTAQRDPTLGEPAFWTEVTKPGESADESQAEEGQEDVRETAGDKEEWGVGRGFEPLLDGPAAISEIETLVPGLARLESVPELPEPAGSLKQTTGLSSELLDTPSPSLLLPELPPLNLSLPDALTVDLQREILQEIPGFGAPVSGAELENVAAPDLKEFAWATPGGVLGELDQALPPKSKDEANGPASATLATLAPFLSALGTEPPEMSDFEPLPEFRAGSQTDSTVLESGAQVGLPAASSMDPATIEAVVLRVIERMQPKVIELVTRELLRPVVEALVQRELEKK